MSSVKHRSKNKKSQRKYLDFLIKL